MTRPAPRGSEGACDDAGSGPGRARRPSRPGLGGQQRAAHAQRDTGDDVTRVVHADVDTRVRDRAGHDTGRGTGQPRLHTDPDGKGGGRGRVAGGEGCRGGLAVELAVHRYPVSRRPFPAKRHLGRNVRDPARNAEREQPAHGGPSTLAAGRSQHRRRPPPEQAVVGRPGQPRQHQIEGRGVAIGNPMERRGVDDGHAFGKAARRAVAGKGQDDSKGWEHVQRAGTRTGTRAATRRLVMAAGDD